jgi:hypothetical protein
MQLAKNSLYIIQEVYLLHFKKLFLQDEHSVYLNNIDSFFGMVVTCIEGIVLKQQKILTYFILE